MSAILEKAKAVTPNYPKSGALDPECAIAWLVGEISISQLSAALNKRTGNCYLWLAQSLREGYRQKMLELSNTAVE
jgi:hypothetical protein